MIYFFELVGLDQVKVGFSQRSPESRLRSALVWVDVRVLLVLPDDTRKDERQVHEQFRDLQVARERFRLSSEFRAILTAVAAGFDWDAELRARLRVLVNAQSRRYTNADRRRELERARRAADPEQDRARQRAWRDANVEWVRERSRKYYVEDHAKHLARAQQYRETHRETHREQIRERQRARREADKCRK